MKRRNFKVLLLLATVLILVLALCACNKDKSYTVSFETNGGDAIASATVKGGETYTLPATAQRSGYMFEGWYLNADLTGDPVTEVKVDNNVTVYAKWSPAVALTLRLSASDVRTIYLKSGTNIRSALESVQLDIPADHIFGDWFVDGNVLSASMTMPATPITVEARFKAHYTVNVYLEQANGSYAAATGVDSYGYAGDYPQISYKGYRLVDDAAGTVYGAISDNASQNAFTVYLSRHGFTMSVRPNCPDPDVMLDSVYYNALDYGESVELPQYELRGDYLFLGWSLDRTATDAQWRSSYIYNNLYNGGEQIASDKYTVEEDNVVLYGVWLKGATDIFGGNDLVFLTGGTQPEAYVWRGGKFFKGDYTDVTGEFAVRDAGGNTVIIGKLNGDGTFSYRDSTRRTLGTYFLYKVGKIDQQVTLIADEYNGITYTDLNLDRDRVSNGTYVLDEDGNYVVTFGEDGPMSGKQVTIMTAQATSGSASTRVFVVRNDDDIALGEIFRKIGDNLYYPSMTLDGFFTATLTIGDSTSTYFYSRMSEDEIWIGDNLGTFGNDHQVLKISQTTLQNRKVWVYASYNAALDHEFKLENGQGTLKLDGIYTGEYAEDFNVLQGVFMTVGTSQVSSGGHILVGLYSDNFSGMTLQYLFEVYSVTTGEGEDAVTEYFYRDLDKQYAELTRLDSQTGNITNDLIIVLKNDHEASIYAVSTLLGYVIDVKKVVDGTYVLENEDNSTYRFTIDQSTFEEEVSKASGLGLDFDQLDYFEFGMASSSGRQLFYYVAYKPADGEAVRFDHVYHSASGDETLTIIGTETAGFATLKDDSGVFSGNYRVQDSIFILTYTDDEQINRTLYLEINDVDGTYEQLSLPLGRFPEYAGGQLISDNYLTFDGKGGATLHEGESEIVGTFAESEDYTLFADLEIHFMTFTSNDNDTQFNYVFMRSGNYVYFVRYNAEAYGKFTQIAAAGETLEQTSSLELDGYFIARYTPDVSNADEHIDVPYSYVQTNVVRLELSTTSGTFYAYFDLKGDNKYTERGQEYTTLCLLYDNSTLDLEYSFTLDGYGNLTVLDGETGDKIGAGTYTLDRQTNAATFTYKLTADGAQKTLKGQLGTVTIGGVRVEALLIEHDSSFEGTYVVTDDFTVLSLDRFGNAVFINKMGLAYRAMYQVVDAQMSDGNVLIFFTGVNSGSTNTSKEAGLFILDMTALTVTPVTYSRPYSYYTQNLDSMLFTRTGCVYIGAELAFYVMDKAGNVTIYRESDAAGASEYGFIKDNSFGTFAQGQEKNFDSKTYFYNVEEGFDIHFSRSGNVSEYPFAYSKDNAEVKNPVTDIYFTPTYSSTESANFSVSGTVRFKNDETSYRCTIVRRAVDGGEFETYIAIDDGGYGYFRFDITVNYGGSNNTFTITGLKHVVELNAWDYEYAYWMLALMYGASYANRLENTLGSIKVETPYDAQGKIIEAEDKFYGTFGEDSDWTDDLGQKFDLSDCEYEQVNVRVGFYSIPCYAVTVTGTDNVTYTLYFSPQNVTLMGSMTVSVGYVVAMITRTQVLTFAAPSDCQLSIETVIWGDESFAAYGIAQGAVYDWSITYGGQEYQPSYSFNDEVEGTTYTTYVVRLTADGVEHETSAKYFKFKLVQGTFADGSKYNVPAYDNAQSTFEGVEDYEVVYSEDGSQWVDYDTAGKKIGMFCYGRVIYVADSCTYNADSDTYTLTVSLRNGEKAEYTAKITAGEDGGESTVTITEVEQPA